MHTHIYIYIYIIYIYIHITYITYIRQLPTYITHINYNPKTYLIITNIYTITHNKRSGHTVDIVLTQLK